MRGGENVMGYGVPEEDVNLTDVIDVLHKGNRAGDLSSFPASAGLSTTCPPAKTMSKTGLSASTSLDPHLQKMKKSAFVQMMEQPAGKGLRFRYECEGRSAGSIPGVSSTNDNRTFPTIRVMGYTGRAVVVVSAVTTEAPHRPHPHNLVGKEGSCKKGVCTMEMGEDMTCSFSNLGIQCVKKKDIEESLGLRQQIRVDPFQTGFTHKNTPQNIDLNCLRLAFQVFLEGNEKGAFTFALKPIVSDPIYDKKAKCDLTICRLTEHSAPVAGGKEILLFCDKVTKDDIQVRFFEEQNGRVVWEGLGDFQPSDVHKQFGICFRTPRYKNIEIEQPVKVQLQLKRPSDGAVSECRSFEFIPLDAGRAYWSAKRLKTNYTVFNQILSMDQAARQGDLQGADLRHKVPRPPAMARTFSDTKQGGEAEVMTEAGTESVLGAAGGARQILRPVAMPGGAQFVLNSNSSLLTNSVTGHSEAIPGQLNSTSLPPQVPVRSPHKSNLLTGVYDPMPQPPEQQNRPTSDMSVMSDFSISTLNACEGGDTASITTRQSVNEILSMADVSVYSGDNVNLDNISVNTFFQDPNQFFVKEEPGIEVTDTSLKVNIQNPMMGSLTSVATVKENKNVVEEQQDQEPTSTTTLDTVEDMDIAQIYDDVMQCVYDDVDVKYDDMAFLTEEGVDAPVPPLRKKGLSVEPGLEKPLPGVPRNKIITKLEEKKNELIKEVEKRKQVEDQRRKEKEVLEEQKRKEREEREKKKLEEREKRRLEEEQKKAQKKRDEDEKKAKKLLEMEEEAKMKQSLFQRLFQRSQSRPGEGDEEELVSSTVLEQELQEVHSSLETPPPVPPHGSIPALCTQMSLENQLSDLEHLIQSGPGDLERLDSVVTEFTSQFGSGDCTEQIVECGTENTTLVKSS